MKKTPEQIAQWVIDNRYPKSENNKVPDSEMYHSLVEDISNVKLKLPYCTESAHEYRIIWSGTNAFVFCKVEENNTTDNLSKSDVLEIIETAKIAGIDTVILNTDYGVDIHSHTLVSSKQFNKFFINKI